MPVVKGKNGPPAGWRPSADGNTDKSAEAVDASPFVPGGPSPSHSIPSSSPFGGPRASGAPKRRTGPRFADDGPDHGVRRMAETNPLVHMRRQWFNSTGSHWHRVWGVDGAPMVQAQFSDGYEKMGTKPVGIDPSLVEWLHEEAATSAYRAPGPNEVRRPLPPSAIDEIGYAVESRNPERFLEALRNLERYETHQRPETRANIYSKHIQDQLRQFFDKDKKGTAEFLAEAFEGYGGPHSMILRESVRRPSVYTVMERPWYNEEWEKSTECYPFSLAFTSHQSADFLKADGGVGMPAIEFPDPVWGDRTV